MRIERLVGPDQWKASLALLNFYFITVVLGKR